MEDKQDIFDFKISGEAERELGEASRWWKVAAILGLVFCGLILLFMIIAGSAISDAFAAQLSSENASTAWAGILIVLIIVIGIAGLLAFFLIRSANRIRNAFLARNQALYNAGLNDLKLFFVIYGILAILGLVGNLLSLV